LAGGALLPVPGSITPEIHRRTLVGLCEAPARPRGGHHQAKRVGPDHALALAALVMAQAIEGMALPYRDVDGPAGAILLQDVLHAERQVRGEEGFDWGRRFALAWLCRTGGGATDHDHAHQPPREDGMPEADPGLGLRLGFRGMRPPAAAPAGPRVGGAQQLALPRRPPAAFARWGSGRAWSLPERRNRDTTSTVSGSSRKHSLVA
jgi:hypothetical protein